MPFLPCRTFLLLFQQKKQQQNKKLKHNGILLAYARTILAQALVTGQRDSEATANSAAAAMALALP